MSSRIFFLALVFLALKGFDAIAEERSATSFAKATFAGGCFWCMEQPFDALPGVIKVISGYTGGDRADPTYKEVSSGGTGHFEAIQIEYNPHLISYQKLLGIFWRNIDPTNDKGQFCDEGSQYRSAIFYHDAEQERLAETSKNELGNSKRFSEAIVTSILPASDFYPAEDYHQHYYRKKPIIYTFYRFTCGRDSRLEQLWQEEDKAIDLSFRTGD